MEPDFYPDVPDHIKRLSPYQPGLPIEALARISGLPVADIIKLASNENPFGMSPRARTAIRATVAASHLYPDGHDLTSALAAHYQLSPTSITLGNGSNDILDLIARVFLHDGTEAISSQYGFAIYAIASTTAGA